MANLKNNNANDDIHLNIGKDKAAIICVAPNTTAKINELDVPESIHLNIKETYDYIDNHLPKNYSREVWNLLPNSSKVDLAYIRTVKKDRIKNAIIMNALYRVAQFHELQNRQL